MAGLQKPSLELRFRIFDGTDICRGTYPSHTTLMSLKERILSEWPQDKVIVPKSVSEIRLIYGSRVLNGRQLANSRILYRNRTGEVITVLVMVQIGANREMPEIDEERQSSCCTIL